MPRAYRARASRRPLSEAARRWLLQGEPTARGAEGFADYARTRFFDGPATWREYGADLVAEWAGRFPGWRPAGWWEHGCPARAERLRVSGSGEPGAPIYGDRTRGYFDCDPANPPLVESDAA